MAALVADEHGELLTVRQLLAEELLRDSLVAGKSGLDAIITWCVPAPPGTSSDLSDLAGALVCVPAEDLAQRPLLLRLLANAGAAAVLVHEAESGSTTLLDERALCASADTLGLPLLLGAAHATFRRTSQLVATKILAQSTHVLEYGASVHRTLGDVFARGAGLGALALTMSRMSGTTVLVLNNGGELLAQGDHEGTACLPENQHRIAGVIGELMSLHGHTPAETGPGHPTVRSVRFEDESFDLVDCPIRVAGDPYGLLVLLERRHPAPGHDLAQHCVMAEEGVSLLGSELLRQYSVREAEERARNDFVHALLHGRFTDHLELAARAEHYGFPLEGRFAVFIASSSSVRLDDLASRRRSTEAARFARAVGIGSQDTVVGLSALIGSRIVVVRELPPAAAGDDASGEDPAAAHAAVLRKAMLGRLGADLRVSYGRMGVGAPGVAASYREARTAEALGRRVDAAEVCGYADLRVFAAIQAAADSPAGLAFAREVLEPLKQADGQTGSLDEVVLAYIAEAGNLNATARRLHLHRNTMLYKLERASRALQMDIRTTEAQFMIWLAHHITALSEVLTRLDDELTPPG